MKKKLEFQTIIVLLCVICVAGAWIGIQVTKDSLGVWSEAAEIHFTSDNLLGIGPRSELRCAGAVVGHIRRITPSVGPDGKARFDLISGIRRDYAAWKFAPVGIVKAGVVESALSPSSIGLELDPGPGAVRAVVPKLGKPPVIPLEKEKSQSDLTEVVEQYRRLGDRIDSTIRQFTEPQGGRTQSVMEELAQAIPSAAESLRNIENVTDNIRTQVSPDGKIDLTLNSLNRNLAQLQLLTEQVSKTVANVNGQLNTGMRKVNGLLDETTDTMSALHGKVDGLGGTFFGRMLIAKPDEPTKPDANRKKPAGRSP
jgi:ABC-type transporter Mla subunit MlaD